MTEEQKPDVLACRISSQCNVRIFFYGVVTKEAIEQLARILESASEAYPTEEELEDQE